MQIRKVIQHRIRHASKGVDVAGDVNAVVAANVNERHSTVSAESKQGTGERRDADEQRGQS